VEEPEEVEPGRFSPKLEVLLWYVMLEVTREEELLADAGSGLEEVEPGRVPPNVEMLVWYVLLA